MHVNLKQGTVTATVFECEQMIKQIQLKINVMSDFKGSAALGCSLNVYLKKVMACLIIMIKVVQQRLAFTARDCKYFTPPCGCRENRLYYIVETLNTQGYEIFMGLALV